MSNRDCCSLMTDDVHAWIYQFIINLINLSISIIIEKSFTLLSLWMHHAWSPFTTSLHESDFWGQVAKLHMHLKNAMWIGVSPEFHLSQCQQDERGNLPGFSSTRRGSQTAQLVFQLRFTAQSFSQLTEGDTKCSREGACPQERKITNEISVVSALNR